MKSSEDLVVEHKGIAGHGGLVFGLTGFRFGHLWCPAKSDPCPAIAGHLFGGAKWLVKL